MPAFYPYNPVTSNTTTFYAAQSTPNPTILSTLSTPLTTPNPNSAGTSLSPPDILAIAGGVLCLFGGLACLVYYALVVVPRKKKALLKERKRIKKEGRRADEVREFREV